MKKLLAVITAFGLLMTSFLVYAQSEQTTTQVPPVEQKLVPEGDLAMKLVASLNMGTAETEAQAEDMLSSAGIAPRNGWIADYPVTPDIMGELQQTVMAAADSNKLAMGRDEALKAFQSVSAEIGLPIVGDTSGKYSENQPPTSPQYTEPAVVDDYYNDEGPPVITYYPPPWDYGYLYAWVPYPFWCSGFFFPGFFVLHDFHRTVFFGHRRFVVTNHVFDHRTRGVVVIDPVARGRSSGFRAERGLSHGREFNSAEAQKGAASIYERSRERVRSGNGMTGTAGKVPSGNVALPRPENRSEGKVFTNSESNTGNVRGRNEVGTIPKGTNGRTSNNPSNIERRNEVTTQRPSAGEGGNFRSPGNSHERSFGVPSMGSRGSFSGSYSGGGHSLGRGGFSSSSHGGCRGRC
jgi:hypothetical protein